MTAWAPSDPPEAGSTGRPRSPEAEPGQPRPPEGLYVHFPFCLSICPYCDFVVVAGSAARGPGSRIGAMLDAHVRELDLRVRELRAGGMEEGVAPLASVYLGGGTPSLMAPADVARLLARVRDLLGLASDAEVTLEANPGRDDLGDLAGFRAAGVDRISIGAQSLDADELRRLGRRHGPADVRTAVRGARDTGFSSISIDLLTDIPGQTLEGWRRTLSQALELAPDHLSVYTLSLDDPDAEGLTGELGDHLPTSRGARTWRSRARAGQSEDRAAAMELLTDDLAASAGLRRYEIANLARPGFESRHNLLTWRRRPALAVGPGAHAFDGDRRRRWNAASLEGYLAALAAGRLPPGGEEVLDDATALAETVILGLRLSQGIEATLADHPQVASTLDWAREVGLVEDAEDRCRLTSEGRLLANEVFARLLPDPPRPPGPAPAGRPASA